MQHTIPDRSPPLYVGSSYYCVSGSPNNPSSAPFTWLTSDPLWDGIQCGGDEGPYCNHTGCLAGLSRIYTATPTTATVNVHLCLDEVTSNESVGIDHLELYVK